VLHHAESYFLLSDVVFSHVCGLVSFRILLRDLNSNLWLCVSWVLTHGAAQPGPAQPRPARPPPLVFSPHSILSRSNLLSHLSLSPRGALGLGDGDRQNLDPRAELPSPLSLSFSPSPPLPSFPCARSLRVLVALRGSRPGGSPRPHAPGRRRLSSAALRARALVAPRPDVPCPGSPAPPPPPRPLPRAPAAVRPRVPSRLASRGLASASPAARPCPGGPAPCPGVASRAHGARSVFACTRL
jgi:hypothetical protein